MAKEYKRFEHPTCPNLFLRFDIGTEDFDVGDIKFIYYRVGNGISNSTVLNSLSEVDSFIDTIKSEWEQCHSLPETFYSHDNTGSSSISMDEFILFKNKLLEWVDIFVFDLEWCKQSFFLKFRVLENTYIIDADADSTLNVNGFYGIELFGDTADELFELFLPNRYIREYKLNQLTNKTI
jgi:hypothetical protein